MAGLNLRFTEEELDALRERGEEELDALRERAAAEGRSMQAFAHDAVMAAVDERSRLFEEAAEHVLKASAELNRRLA